MEGEKNALNIIASGTFTLTDLNDALIAGSAPKNPTVNTLWIDSSITPNMLKKWNGTQWVNIAELNLDISSKISKINKQLDDMINDSIIDFQERQILKDKLSDIIGYVISDQAATLPSVEILDSSAKGKFYTVRKSARQAKISTDDEQYVLVATTYNNLKSYLESLVPIMVWDTSSVNRNLNITVVRDTLRDKFIQYYLSVESLSELITEKLQGSIDGLIIGARNLIQNSTFNIFNDNGNLTSWTWVDSRWIVNQPEDDKPNSNILYINVTGATAPVYASAYTNKYNARKGDVFTVSFDIKVGSLAGWDQKFPLLVEFYDSSSTRVQYKTLTLADLNLTSMTDNTWYRASYTTTVTEDSVMTGAIRLILWENGELYFREIQMEKGMKATDYKAAPEDTMGQVSVLEQRVADAEQKITDESIISVVTQSDTYLADINKKADADELGNYATSGELDEAINSVNDNIDKKINDIDFTPYVKTATLTQTVNDITAKFENGGGINQLKNSVGYAGADFWTVSGVQFQSIQTDELAQLGYSSGFYSPVGTGGWISQDVYTTVGLVYTFSVYMKKTVDSATNGYAGVDILDQTGTKLTFVGKGTGRGVTNGYEKFVYTFTSMTPIHTIRITVGNGAEATFTGAMFNVGDVALQWSLAPGELYNTNIQMNMNGLKVNQVENGVEKGFTVMTPDKFAGYYDMDNNGTIDEEPGSQDEVFRMDKDEFVMKKATVKEEITMGTVKIVKINSASVNGWAFVSNQDD